MAQIRDAIRVPGNAHLKSAARILRSPVIGRPIGRPAVMGDVNGGPTNISRSISKIQPEHHWTPFGPIQFLRFHEQAKPKSQK